MDQIYTRPTFESFYRSEYPGLVGVAAALTGDRRDSEDLVQDTMVKAFLRWNRVSTLDRPWSWCHRVLTNACRSWFRRRRTEHRHVRSLRPLAAVSPGPSEEAIAFWDVVRQLPSRPRSVVALYFAGDRSCAEIAEILGVPEGTVRSDIARARSFVLRSLEG